MMFVCVFLSKSYVASRTQHIFHEVAQFKSFVKVFVPGGRLGRREGSWLRNMTRQNGMAEESGDDIAEESFCQDLILHFALMLRPGC